MRRLPRSLDDVADLRAARLTRESTEGQHDNFGPDAQHEQQARAIARYALVDTGIEWSLAASGWKEAWRTPEWADMIARAGTDYDVLVVGYVSRFMRNLKQTLIAVEDHLHPAGVPVLFADERLLSSDPDDWDQFVREAHEAESYSRKLSKRVREGYASKRRRIGVPGGNRVPLGARRDNREMVVDDEALAIVRHAFELAATGATDFEVAAATGLAHKRVAEVLTNPFYVGRLRGGEPSALGVLVDPALFSRVQAGRERRRTREPGSLRKRNYALKLRCAGCGRWLYGDTGRYRHPSPTCEDFIAHAHHRRRAYKNANDRRVQGSSYPAEWYEHAVGRLIEQLGSVDDATLAEVVALWGDRPDRIDEVAVARIARERDEAARKLARTRDVVTWQATMARLDREEEAAREPAARPALTPAEVVERVRSLPMLWRESGVEGRQALATSLFASLDVLGVERYEYALTQEAIDLGLAAGPAVFEVRGSFGEFGRGERI